MGKRNLIYIEFLRTFALLGVIFFHVMGMLKDKLANVDVPEFSTIMRASGYWVGFAVPLFMFIAGYLYKQPAGKEQITTFVKKKATRLLLPYVIFTVLIMLSQGFFSLRELVSGAFWHLWFLLALFWCFIASLCVDYSSKWGIVVLVAALWVSMVEIPRFLGISGFFQWYYFFVLGAVVKSHPGIIKSIKKYYIWVLLVAVYIGINALVPFHYSQPSVAHSIAESAAILVVWLIFTKLKQVKLGVFLAVGECSMGIYILHYWLLIYMLSSTSFRMFNIIRFMETCPWGTVMVIVGVTFALSFVVTYVARINKVGRLLLG